MNILINGFGRIGRILARQILKKKNLKLVHVNDIIQDVDNIIYLLKYDSTYGKLQSDLKLNGRVIESRLDKFIYTSETDIKKIKFQKKIDVILDSSGDEKNINSARKLIKKGFIKYYIFTMTSNLVDREIVFGLNDNGINKEKIFSSSICDSNAIIHFLNFINQENEIVNGSVTTLHPWLTYQNLLDGAAKGIGPDPNKYTPKLNLNSHLSGNFALGRSSISALIPKKTTAISVCEKLIPELKNKIISHSFRVPTSVVSCADIVLNLKKNDDQIIKKIFKWTKTKKFLDISNDYCTSKDFEGNEHSAILDKNWVYKKDKVLKLVLWYDNEWGYSARVLDLAQKLINEKKNFNR